MTSFSLGSLCFGLRKTNSEISGRDNTSSTCLSAQSVRVVTASAMKNIDHALKLVRSASLTLDVVRLRRLHKVCLGHTALPRSPKNAGIDCLLRSACREAYALPWAHSIVMFPNLTIRVPSSVDPVVEYLAGKRNQLSARYHHQ